MHAIFWINLPIGALALLLPRYVPESRAPRSRPNRANVVKIAPN